MYCVVRLVIIQGIGNYIEIYEIETNELVASIQVFDSNKITRLRYFLIRKMVYKVYVIGENLSKVFDINIETFAIKETQYIEMRDYCLDVFYSEDFVIYGYTNNFIEIYQDIKLIRTVFCPENCIVYSLELYRFNDTLIIASGTVFRNIVIWILTLDFKVKLF
jgi:hypothetical protein